MAPHPDRTQALFEKLQRFVHVPSSPKPETVHRLRTTIRRVETLMTTVRPASPEHRGKKLMKQLDRIRRRAGKVRDVDVQITALDSLQLESITRDKARVKRFLQKARIKREQKLLTTCRDELQNGLQRRIKRAATRLQETPSSDRTQPELRADRFLHSALERFAALVTEYPVLNESNLHEFRMACKRVRYLAEMAGEVPDGIAVIAELKRIQDSVGEWHDWLTLTDTAEGLLPRPGQSPLLAALRASTRSKYLEALRTTADAKRNLLDMLGKKREPRSVTSEATRQDTRAASA